VMRQPVGLSPEQIAIFSRLYPMNARPVQSAAGRIIKQSN
jgi:carbonic anhydrase